MKDDKRSSPAAIRNREVIANTLLPLIDEGAQVLEIASGTGEHGTYMAARRPDLDWQMTDISQAALRSCDAWREHLAPHMPPSLHLDVMQRRWPESFTGYNVLYCANMIHIAPWAAAEGLAAGLSDALLPSGIFAIYGPFKFGDATAPSNLEFDASLKLRDPAWGVREYDNVHTLFEAAGLTLEHIHEMPAQNHLLIFRAAPI